jgi:hypothetical protein
MASPEGATAPETLREPDREGDEHAGKRDTPRQGDIAADGVNRDAKR